MNIEVHTTIAGELSAVRPDPYVWVDPFAEAEQWAVLWGKAATGRAQELDGVRREYEREVTHLRGVIAAQQRVMMDWVAAHPPAIIIKDPNTIGEPT